MARTYRRDARGRFASGGYSGQTSGRGARLKAGGKSRAGGGARVKAAGPKGTVGKPAGLKPRAIRPKAAPAKASRRKESREARLAQAAARAERLAAKRKEQLSADATKAREMRLDAYALKGKKKQEAALADPKVQQAQARANARQSQLRTARGRAESLRSAYIDQLSKGKGEAGKVAPKDRKRYDMLKASRNARIQEMRRDSHNLAYNTNSMGYEQTRRVQARHDLNKRRLERQTATLKRLANVSDVSNLPTPARATWASPRIKRPKMGTGRRSNVNKSSGVMLGMSMPYYHGNRKSSIYKPGQKNKVRASRVSGVVAKPKPRKPAPPAPTAATRTRSQAAAAQRGRRNVTLDRTRTGSLGMGRMRRNPRIRKQQTGMSQLSLTGRATPLVRYKRI